MVPHAIINLTMPTKTCQFTYSALFQGVLIAEVQIWAAFVKIDTTHTHPQT
jgi:hypothetical protein